MSDSPVGNFAPILETQDAATEAPTTPTPVEKPSEDRFASKFGALSRKEKALVEKEKAIAEKLAKVDKWEQSTAKFNTDRNPADILAFIEENLGVDFSTLMDAHVEATMTKPKLSETELLKKELEDFKRQLTDKESKKEEEANALKQQAEEKVYSEAKELITSHIKENPESLELLHSLGNVDMVFDTIKAYFEESNELLDYATACTWCETYLEQQLEGLTKINKFKQKIAPDTKVEDKQVDMFRREPNTLIQNSMGAHSRPAPKEQQADPLDRHERIKRLLARNPDLK